MIRRIGRPAKTHHRPQATHPPLCPPPRRREPAVELGERVPTNQEEPLERGQPVPAPPARARAPRSRGFRPASPLTAPVSSSCPETESPRWAEAPRAARVSPGLEAQQEVWPRIVSRGPASPLDQSHGPQVRPRLAPVHCLTAAALSMTGPACHRPEDRDLRLKWEACAMPGPRVGATPRWPLMRAGLRLESSPRWPLIPWHRRPWATSAQQPKRAPQPTPLDWTAGPVSAPIE